MIKLALLVGIDDYPKSPLSGCVKDATRMHDLLQRNLDETPNFDCKTHLSPHEQVTRPILKQAVEDLFKRQADVAIFFFAGHGTATI